ncbi:alpha/beta hydrolase [Nesterenkonia sp. F]|uniref:alpha/beta hydrolase n=1 Tax=Nesterenkonia sp. F TaxID=795955 RepID=UPI000255C96E|nr:alpha/beta hydrolase fold domain-containing protein [Nesterenkonia sp. F]
MSTPGPRTPSAALEAVEAVDRILDGPHGQLPVRTYRAAAAAGPGEPAQVPTASQPATTSAPRPLLVWAHGGGFAYGSLDMAEGDWVARALAVRGVAVISVDYGLAPPVEALEAGELRQVAADAGVHHPVPGEELAFALDWAREQAPGLGADPAAVSLGGASAGGNLAAGVAVSRLGDGGTPPRHLVLAYPTLHAVQPPTPEGLRALLDADPEADRFGPDPVRRMYENHLGGPIEEAPLAAVPGTATPEQLAGHPPTTIVTSEVDELRVSGEAHAETLRAAGVDVELAMEPGVRHGHLNRPDEGQAAVSTIERVAARLLG